MKKTLLYWQLIGFTAVSVLGTLLHFLYHWTQSPIVALFSSVNESTWEHTKLLFFPMLIFALAQWLWMGKKHPGFWCVKCKGVLLGLLLIPVLFYTLSGIFGTLPAWINIGIFYVSAAFGFIYETYLFSKENTPCLEKLSVLLLCLLGILFFVFTFYPPHIPLFLDPVTKTYGLQ